MQSRIITNPTREAVYTAYRAALALERIANDLDIFAGLTSPDTPGRVALKAFLDERANELAHLADALRESHALDSKTAADVARLTGDNARTVA